MDDWNIFGPGLNLPWNIHELCSAPTPCIQLPKNGFVANVVEKQPLDHDLKEGEGSIFNSFKGI